MHSTGATAFCVVRAAKHIYYEFVIPHTDPDYLRSHPCNAGIWHLLGEVAVVFGFWAMVLMLFMSTLMVIAGTRPVLQFAGALVQITVDRLPRCPVPWC